uniref:6,7-dimethyl-8-ribityllumazine synthase n=1 Tax=Albugo laibachii Nc14 TaxID=890382 RepID=F0W7Y5_9STRA|nr:6 putative [Albugo laibachii Nc14]|eukprot:CCA17238.1 6 putative [Albugo laibachii Nc14]
MTSNPQNAMIQGIKMRGATGAVDGRGLRIAIVSARWNAEVVQALVAGARKELLAAGVADKDIVLLQVAGAYELPYASNRIITQQKIDAVIPIGCLIKGSTMHFEYIAEAVSQGLMRVQLESHIPVMFGVLTCLTEEQARDRAGLTANGHNHGGDWALTAIEMARLRERTIHSGCPMRLPEKTPYHHLSSCPFFSVSAWLHVATITAVGVAISALFKKRD